MCPVDMNVAILTNMVAPYRAPLFKALATHSDVDGLTVLVCVDKESDRQWAIPQDASFKVRQLRGTTIERSAGGDRRRVLHLRWEVMSWLWKNRPDRVLIGDASWTSYLAALACRIARIPYLVWSEITPSSKVSEGMAARLRRWMYRSAGGCVAASHEAATFLRNQGVPAGRIHLATNAIDHDALEVASLRWRPHAAQVRLELGVAEGAFVFLFVGQLITRKRVSETMAELEKAAAKRAIHLVVAGAGPMEAALMQQAAECEHLSVSFAGFVEHDALWRLFAAADALILLSDDEPWGMVISEALAFGLPFLATSSVAAAVEFSDLGRVVLHSEGIAGEISAFIEAHPAHITPDRMQEVPRPKQWAQRVVEALK